MMLDHLTHGRVMGGMGPGSLPSDSAMIGLTPTDTRELLDTNLDIVVRRGRDSVLACIGFLKRNQLRYRPRLAFILIGHRRAVGRARERRSLNNGPAFRACNGRFVEIEETHAALLALVLVTEFRFGHGTYLSKGRLFGRVSDLKPACQMEVEPRCRLPESLQSPSAQPRTKRILWELGLGGSDNLGIWGFPRGRKSDSRLICSIPEWRKQLQTAP